MLSQPLAADLLNRNVERQQGDGHLRWRLRTAEQRRVALGDQRARSNALDRPIWQRLAHPLDLWRRACAGRRPINDDQLAVLASEHDAATGGHGWYWVGRAILAAALSEDIHTLAKVRRTLERWRAEDAYGSDAPAGRRPQAAIPSAAPRPGRSTAELRPGRPPLSTRMNLGAIFEEI